VKAVDCTCYLCIVQSSSSPILLIVCPWYSIVFTCRRLVQSHRSRPFISHSTVELVLVV